jgi:hypothetical protein
VGVSSAHVQRRSSNPASDERVADADSAPIVVRRDRGCSEDASGSTAEGEGCQCVRVAVQVSRRAVWLMRTTRVTMILIVSAGCGNCVAAVIELA